MDSIVKVGMGGWDLFPFDRVFYPRKRTKGFRKLEYYSLFWDFVELNASFYNNRFTKHHAAKWLEDVSSNKRFCFAVKLYRGFTHTFNVTREDVLRIHRFLEQFAAEGRLAGLLIQFPSSFTNTPEKRRYVMQLGRAFQLHTLYVEVRHHSWNNGLTFNFLLENKLQLVNVDLPGIKKHMPLTCEAWNGTAYFRMMGRNVLTWDRPWRINEQKTHLVSDRYLYKYSDLELEKLFGLIEMIRKKVNKVFVVFHNDPNANSLVNGFQLRHLLEKRKLLVPSNLVQARPELKPMSTAVNVKHPLFLNLQRERGTQVHHLPVSSQAWKPDTLSSFLRDRA